MRRGFNAFRPNLRQSQDRQSQDISPEEKKRQDEFLGLRRRSQRRCTCGQSPCKCCVIL